MTDLNEIYSSPKVLFWLTLLGLYGTAEGLGRLVRHVLPLFQNLMARWRSGTHDTDYYFSYRENGYIIMPGGTDYVNSRRERVVALKRIEDVPFTYKWSGEGTITEELFPDTYTMEDLPRVAGQRATRKHIKFGTPLEKGEVAEYTVLLKCKQDGRGPEPFLRSKSSHRVDELLLRVAFPANLMPDHVVYIKRNADGIELSRESIKERDRLTGEFRKLIKYAEPHASYVLEWQGISTTKEARA
jgi:hypothetical protein